MEIKKNFIKLTKTWKSQRCSDGDGVVLNRVIGNREVPRLDPFLMLDFIEEAALPAGFPDHMHRGFETVTYLIKGKFLHEDFKGNKGELNAGDVQWMTAGRGIVHAEMPASGDIISSGFQLWIDLEKSNKMCEPKYQEIKKEQVPEFFFDDYDIRVISGTYQNKNGACHAKNPTSYYDINVKSGKEISIEIEEGMNGFLFVYEGGDIFIEGTKVSKLFAGCFSSNIESTVLRIKAENSNSKFLLIFGKPLNQPVFQRGPVVMCSEEDVYKAFTDYKQGINGFENAKSWESQIQYLSEKI